MSSDDATPQPPNPGFEGPEKVLEIDFAPGIGPARGLREITRAQWDRILTEARCTILNSLSNEKLDSYVLSESSLFVYPLKMLLKTCGTTTLLRALDPLLEITESLGMKVEWVAYTRKNFNFPEVQKFPHRAPQEESTYLTKYFPEGSAFLMGPMSGDHWFVFVADYVDRPTTECVDRTLDMMMFGIDEDVAKLFVKDSARFPKDSDVTKASGIDTLLPGSSIQEFCFEPCGYSMNGLLYDAYWTIHITPESHCSYASFETNIRMKDYSSLVKAVLAIFRPSRFTMTLFADEHGLKALTRLPFDQLLTVPLVETQASAVMGPCVMLADGNTLYPPISANGGASPVTVVPISVGAGNSGVFSAVTTSVDPSSVPVSVGNSTGNSPTPEDINSTNNTSSAASTATPLVVADATAVVAAVAVATTPTPTPAPSTGMRRNGSFAVGRRGALSYVSSHKSSSEFMGYSCFMSNFKLVHTHSVPSGAVGMSSTATGNTVPEAAKDILSMPRAKYIVSQRLEALKQRVRTESF